MYDPYDGEHERVSRFFVKWLIKTFNIEMDYEYTFRDKWIIHSIWGDDFYINGDNRNESWVKLFNLMPDKYKGTPQHGTGIIVNKDSLYFKISDYFDVHYPTIIRTRLIKTVPWKDGEGGYFNVYHHELFLSDGTSMEQTNQDLTQKFKEDNVFRAHIAQRHIYNEIKQLK